MTAKSDVIPHSESARQPGYDYEFDATGLSCPLPFLNTRKSVESLRPGEVVKVISTDGECLRFFESMVRQTGLELLVWNVSHGVFNIYLQKN